MAILKKGSPTEEAPPDLSMSPLVTALEGGDVEVDFSPEESVKADAEETMKEHGSNLAEFLDESILGTLGSQVVDDTRGDLESRAEWEQLISNGLCELGLKMDEASEPFEGACTATHPLLIENVVKFQAKAAMELMPPSGPVRTRIYGKLDDEKEKKAERVKEFLNWQTMEQMVEWVDEKERLLFYYALMGTGITKTYYDSGLDRPVTEYVPIDQFVVNYSAPDLRRAERFTHIITRSEDEFKRDVESGVYRDVGLGAPAVSVPSEIQARTDELLGFTPPPRRKVYTLYEQHLYARLDAEGLSTDYALPYIVTVDSDTGKVLSIRRGWRKGDHKFQRLEWFTRYVFVPGMSFYGLGLLHLIGSLAKAATMSTRNLIDSGMFSNLQGGFKLRGMKIVGDNSPIAPGEWKDVEATTQDLSKAIVPLPFKEPSQTLFALLQFVVAAGQKFADTAEQVIADSTNYGPVGTTLALLEASTKFFSGIHKRLHAALKQELKILRRLDEDFLPQEYPYDVEGDSRKIFRSDFTGCIDVCPSSDPNTPSNAHRVTKATTVMQIAAQRPDLHDMREILKQTYMAMEVPNIDKILPLPKVAVPADPLTDIKTVSSGHPIAAFPGQDHDAHIQIKTAFISNPMAGGSPAFQQVVPLIVANIREHMLMRYTEAAAAQGAQTPQAQAMAVQALTQQDIQKAQAQALQAQQQGQGDQQLAMAELQQRAKEHSDNVQIKQAELQIRGQEIGLRSQNEQQKHFLAGAKLGHLAQSEQRKHQHAVGGLALEAAKTQQDATIAAADLAHKKEHDQAQIMLEAAKFGHDAHAAATDRTHDNVNQMLDHAHDHVAAAVDRKHEIARDLIGTLGDVAKTKLQTDSQERIARLRPPGPPPARKS